MKESEPIWRYERKAFVTDFDHADLLHLVKTHPAVFREIHHERTINNIYFDTPTFENYQQNVAGDDLRTKVRLRWYGELWGPHPSVLEFKIKRGMLGRKEHYPVDGIALQPGFDVHSGLAAIGSADMPASAKHFVARQEPKLLNRYDRRYFESHCKRFRVTIDKDLRFHHVRSTGNHLLHSERDVRSLVVEIKYDAEHDNDVNRITDALPFFLTKSSKYAYGIDRLWGLA
jgi:hypothetical protein